MKVSQNVAPGSGTSIASTDISGNHFVNVLSSSIIMRPEAFVFSWLKNGTEKSLALANGSLVSPVHYDYTPPTDFDFLCKDTNFLIRSNAITLAKFGGIAALTNGCLFQIVESDGTVVVDLLGGETLKNNGDFFHLAGAETIVDTYVHVKWNILTTGAAMIIANGRKLRFSVRDNITGLSAFRIAVQGLLMPTGMRLPAE